ncbi:late competence development ComFB family protein [Bacillus sp. CGMCC 1.16607]|uniref:late competence development ComFB family protein n=1 Tax=Bacillus sp. CGMCC 1.16607 TaxID=3351842 RepID=UPI003626EFD4
MDNDYVNVMEEMVSTLVTVLMMGTEYQTFCQCKKCINDIIALSLNTLPSHYVTTDEGRMRVFEQLNTNENRKWINKRIISAIHLVGKYPKHNK